MAEIERNEMVELEAFFAAARQAPTPAPEALMARVLADAQAVQAAGATAVARPRPTGRFWAGMLAAIGGWPAVGGLAAATVAGVWIGFSPALGVGDAMAGALNVSGGSDTYLVDLMPGYGLGLDAALNAAGLGQEEAG